MPGGVEEAKVAVPNVGEIRGTETVLIAEDHESIREMVRQTLASLGYRVLGARLLTKAAAGLPFVNNL